MARITLRQLLDHAAEHDYGVPAFNINNMEQALAIMDAASSLDAPVIVKPPLHHAIVEEVSHGEQAHALMMSHPAAHQFVAMQPRAASGWSEIRGFIESIRSHPADNWGRSHRRRQRGSNRGCRCRRSRCSPGRGSWWGCRGGHRPAHDATAACLRLLQSSALRLLQSPTLRE